MPGAQKQKSRRVEQCVYTEGGRRCRRSGTGDPPICNAHLVVLADAARQGAKPRGARAVGDGIFDLVDRLVSGKKMSRQVMRDAFADARTIMDEFVQATEAARAGIPPTNGHSNGDRRPPPQVDPQRRARVMARQVLGFAPTDELTVELIKKRQRELARRHHPDHGGSVEKMKEINAAVDVLLASLVT